MRDRILSVAQPIRKDMEQALREADEVRPVRVRITAVGMCDVYAPEVTQGLVGLDMQATTVVGLFHDVLKEEWAGHVWTECEGLIVDITVDQFGEHLPRILIGTYEQYPQYRKDVQKTKQWHRQFPGEP